MVCASARKFVYRAFSIDRRGGYYEIFFCRDLGEFALACRRRGVGGRRHRNSTAGHASITRDALAGGSGCGVLRATSTARAAASCSPPAASSGGWSIWPAAWSISPAAVSSSPLIRSKAVPDSAARGHLGGLLRTLQRVPALPLPRDFARGSTGPLGGGQRAARRQGGLERGGFLGWLLVGADNRERDGTGDGDAIPHRTADRRPPRLVCFSSSQTHKQTSLGRGAVMAQDRRSPPSATQDTNQPPIVRPHSATLSPSAFLVGCCDRSSSPPSQRRNPTAAAAILRTCGRPAVRSARIRTQRVDHPPRDRGSTPRRARAVDPRPYYWPLARPQPRLVLSPGNGAHPVEPALSHPSPFPGDSTSRPPPQLADHHHHRGRGSPPTPAVHPSAAAGPWASGRHRVHSHPPSRVSPPPPPSGGTPLTHPPTPSPLRARKPRPDFQF